VLGFEQLHRLRSQDPEETAVDVDDDVMTVVGWSLYSTVLVCLNCTCA
jgi:hypothetical protein